MAFIRFWVNSAMRVQAIAYDDWESAYADWARLGDSIAHRPDIVAARFNARSDPPPAVPQAAVESHPDASPRARVDGSTVALGVAWTERGDA